MKKLLQLPIIILTMSLILGSSSLAFAQKGLFPVLGRLYGRKNIFIFSLKISPETSISRNSKRLICSVCGSPLLTAYYPKTNDTPRHCPVCGGKLYRRTLDSKEVIKVRLGEYKERTEPVIRLAKKIGYRVIEMNGAPAPYMVSKKIYDYLKKSS